ncbi:V-type ATPase [Eremomyces bilateralis CBS 781.70]|uniref:V-type proton ATPase subunit G n=1 Tax=Eremomyces bilateralis CBS 781.70 TaxID=1392243 RepID=A0A6G1FQY2_9PEZI|nr:V-type ATPase [Eremomyces bilateralis CBS 781.70]KAF1808120.1 V-type ATPase [Eremomyces bilateralis CBS 781.70]
MDEDVNILMRLIDPENSEFFRDIGFQGAWACDTSSSAQNSAGIQTLLDAEREAQKIVQKAREYRTKRVKDARSEAQKEIEEYRKQKEGEFKAFEKEHTSGNKKMEQDAADATEEKLKQIRAIGGKKGGKVIEDLLRAVVEVHPAPATQ